MGVAVLKRRVRGNVVAWRPTGPFPSVHGTSAGGWTLHDPNGVVQTVVPGAPNGIDLTLKAPGIFGVPGLGATWSRPLEVDATGLAAASFEPENVAVRLQLYSRLTAFAGNPSQVRILAGFMNAADPTAATSGILWGGEYTATNTYSVSLMACVAGVWAALAPGTGQTDHFGTDGSFCPRSPTQIFGRTCMPLDSTGAVASVGANVINNTGVVICAAQTHFALFAGWVAAGGTVGDRVRFDSASWIYQLTGRG